MEASKEAAGNMAMSGEKSKLREILDVFEEAGFTVTYFFHYDDSKIFKIAIKSDVIKDIVRDYEKEPASAGDVIPLIEKNNYRMTNLKTGVSVVSDYAGTIYFEMSLAGTT
jgi:hypothetical protein